jgi:hypothetical protein
MSEPWQQVVVEKDPATMVAPDVANLGPAPRDLTPALKLFIRKQKPAWDVLVLFFAVTGIVVFVAMLAGKSTSSLSAGAVVQGLVLNGGFLAFALWFSKRRRAVRASYRTALRDGHLRFARIVEYRQTQVAGGAGQTQLAGRGAYRYDLVFDVDGRRVSLRSFDDGMSMINRGQLVEVLYNPAVPDVIVPTFLLV